MGPVWLAASNKCVCSSLGARMAQKSTESSRLSVKWPGLKSRRHAIYVWSLLVFSCSKRFFLLVLHLFRRPKPSLHKFQFDLERANTFWRVNSLHLHYSCPRSLPACSRDGKKWDPGNEIQVLCKYYKKKSLLAQNGTGLNHRTIVYLQCFINKTCSKRTLTCAA